MFSDWTSQPTTLSARNQSLMHRFTRNKTHILKIISARTENVLREKIRNAAQRLRQQSPDFIISNAARFLYAKKMTPLCGEMRANFRTQKQDALINVTNSSRKMSKTVFLEPRDIGHDRWTLATLRFALGRASADRVATTTQIEKLRGVCPSRFVHARRPVQWPRQMGFSHITQVAEAKWHPKATTHTELFRNIGRAHL